MFELRLFGPLALRRNEVAVDLRFRKALALLALLAVDGPHPREALAARLWPQLDAAAGRRNLRREVFRLRKLGLHFDEGDAGRLALADVAIDTACAGAPLAWLEGSGNESLDDWLRDARVRLLSQRRQTRLQQAQQAQQRGEAAAAIAIWCELLDTDACDDEALGHAMQALAAGGQPARALALFGRSAAAMRERLGVEPSAAVAALAAGLRSPPSQPRASERSGALGAPTLPLYAERVPFVPRAAAGAAVRAAWNRRQPVWLAGISGVGKTRLAAECAAAHGPWLHVACLPADRTQAYASIVRLLRALRAAAPDVVLPDWVLREVAQLLPELGPPPAPAATGEARARLLAGVDAALAALADGNYAVLVLDDWQWADDASAEIWGAFDTAAWPLVLLTCFRSAQLPPAALAQMRREVDAGRATLVELQGFDADETLALTHTLSSSPGGRLFSSRLQTATDGNAFFLIETLRHLHQQALLQIDDQGRWSTPFDEQTLDYAELPVPASVRDAVLARVRALGPRGEQLLQVASLLDAPLDPVLLAEVTGLDEAAVLALLEHAVAARLLAEREGAWVFAHDLVQQTLAESQALRRRRPWHRRLAAALERQGAEPTRVALQHERAGDPERAVPHRLRAGDAAWRVHALVQAAEQWRAALDDRPTPEQAVQAWLSLAGLHRRAADLASVQRAVDAALAAAAQASAPVRRSARLACAEVWVGAHRVEAAEPLLAAFEADSDAAPPVEQARALALRATLAGWAGRTDEAVRQYEAAVARLQGLPEALVQLGDMLDSASRILIGAGRSAEAQGFARRAVATLEAAGEPPELARALVMDGVCALYVQGDTAAALQRFERAHALARRCGHVPAQRAAILNIVKLHVDAGRCDEALALLAEGEALAPGFEFGPAEQAFLNSRYFIHYLRGEVAAAEATADRIVAMARRIADRHILIDSLTLVSDLPILTGRFEHAQALLDEAQALIDADPGQGTRTMVVGKRAWLALEQGRLAHARALLATTQVDVRSDEKHLWAWVSAAVAVAEGDMVAAQRALQDHPPSSEAPTDILSMLLVQHLEVARRGGRDDGAARTRAHALLGAGAVPELEARRLRAALGGVPINGGSTPGA